MSSNQRRTCKLPTLEISRPTILFSNHTPPPLFLLEHLIDNTSSPTSLDHHSPLLNSGTLISRQDYCSAILFCLRTGLPASLNLSYTP